MFTSLICSTSSCAVHALPDCLANEWFLGLGHNTFLMHLHGMMPSSALRDVEKNIFISRLIIFIDLKSESTLLDPESDKWLNAMNVEMQSMKDNEVWDLVDLPPNGKTVGSKWLFQKETIMDGAVLTFKACLVAKGFTQTYGVDYEETFSPVADIRAIRILIVIAAYYDHEIWKMDVKTAFLNGHLSEEVYMEQPEGFVNPKYPNRVISHEGIPKRGSNPNARKLRLSKSQEFISGLGVVPIIEEPINMYCDNTGAITIANESGITKGARHFRAKVHYLREAIKYGDVKLEKVYTNDNLADLFTKALAFPKHSEHTRNIGMLSASNLM
ncbi:putative retrotransposon ty1-copia subclass protein [Tanacetum coccineum]